MNSTFSFHLSFLAQPAQQALFGMVIGVCDRRRKIKVKILFFLELIFLDLSRVSRVISCFLLSRVFSVSHLALINACPLRLPLLISSHLFCFSKPTTQRMSQRANKTAKFEKYAILSPKNIEQVSVILHLYMGPLEAKMKHKDSCSLISTMGPHPVTQDSHLSCSESSLRGHGHDRLSASPWLKAAFHKVATIIKVWLFFFTISKINC